MDTLPNTQHKAPKGFEEIYSDTPYIDTEQDGDRILIHMLYVPQHLRGQGKGRELVNNLLAELPDDVKSVRLKSATLDNGDPMGFWLSFGFKPAYDCTCKENLNILNLSVNGHDPIRVEKVLNEEERHYIFD